jgi:hypothetical protein
MRASVMLEKSSDYRILDLANGGENSAREKRSKVLVLNKVTETGAPFIVVVGYFLSQIESFDQSVLAEIETAPTSDYTKIKEAIRKNISGSARVPITFW